MRKLPVILTLLLTCIVRADVVVLSDGTRLEGDLKRTGDGWTMTTADGKAHNIAVDAVRSVQLGSTTAPRSAQQSAEALASLRRSVEALTDINQIIERYQRLIDNTKDAATLADAQSDLAMWRQRKERGLVKHGSKWVTADVVTLMAAQATAQAADARELIRQNRMRDADQMLVQALAIDPHNAAAMYLRGVVLYRQDKLIDARKAFDAVNAIVPQHPPTLNNLAVICWRQNQQPAALNFYDQAMQAAGVNEYILNNAAEALGSLTDDQRKGTVAAKVLRRFAEQDQLLQQQKAQQGLYRWGSTWVDQKKLDELKASEKEVRSKIDSMQSEFDQANARIGVIDTNVASNEQTMNNLRYSTVFADGRGNTVYMPPPQAYYDLQHQNQQLRDEQDSLRTRMATLQEQAQRVKQQLPVPQFTGVQQIVGVEGMPLPPDMPAPSAPATLPIEQP